MKKIFILLSSIIILTIGLSESCEIYVTGYSESYCHPYFDLDVDFGSGWENINDVENYIDNVLNEGYGNDMELSATLEPGIYEFTLTMDGNGHAYMSLTIAGVEYILESYGMFDMDEITITVDGDVCEEFNSKESCDVGNIDDCIIACTYDASYCVTSCGAGNSNDCDEACEYDSSYCDESCDAGNSDDCIIACNNDPSYCETSCSSGNSDDCNLALAYAAGVASVTCEDEITQADIDAAYAEGAASVTPDDGITQEDVDAAAMESYILGAQSGDISGDDNLNVTDIVMYIEKILED